MLNENIFSKEVEEQLRYFRTSSQKEKGKSHFPINLCYLDTHKKELELKDTFKRLKILDDIAKSFDIGYVLHFEEQTFVAVFDYQKSWSDNCYQQATSLVNKLKKSFQKLKFLQNVEDNFGAMVLCLIILLFILPFFINEFNPQMQIKMTNLDMLGFLITFVLIIIDWKFENYINQQKAKLDKNFEN